jgi:3-phosphoglycerate kinase
MGAIDLEKIGHDVEKFWLSKYESGKLRVTFNNPVNRVEVINISRQQTFKDTLQKVISYISKIMLTICRVKIDGTYSTQLSIKSAKNYANFKVNEKAYLDYNIPNNTYATKALYTIA